MSSSWPSTPIGEILTQVSREEAVDALKEYRVLGARWYGAGLFTKDVKSGQDIRAKSAYRVQEGDFVYNRLFAWKGSFAVATKGDHGAHVSNEFPCFTINRDRIDAQFLWWYFRRRSSWAQAFGLSTGATPTSRNRLKEASFLRMKLPLPPLGEQRRVVARIEELAAQIHEARTLRHQAAEETEALIPSAVSAIDGEMRTVYAMTKLENFASRRKGSLRSGPFGSALLHDEFVPAGVPAIGIQDVKENRFDLSRKWNVTPQKADALVRYTIKPRDILVTVMGTLGRACVVPDQVPRMISTKHVWTITLDQTKAEPRWASFWINYSRLAREELLVRGTGTAIPGLNGEKLRNLSLPEVPLAEQRRIVAELDVLQTEVDALRRLQAETAAELDALLPSVLAKAFSGALN